MFEFGLSTAIVGIIVLLITIDNSVSKLSKQSERTNELLAAILEEQKKGNSHPI